MKLFPNVAAAIRAFFAFLRVALSGDSDVSSKRFCGFISLLVFLGLVIACTVYLWIKDILELHMATLFGFLVAIIAAFFTLTIAEAPWKKGE